MAEFTHIEQPTESHLCGQACVAMCLGITLDEAIERIGHNRSTRTREIVTALGAVAAERRLVARRAEPEDALLKVTWAGRPRRSHWVIRRGCTIHDPALRGAVLRATYDRMITRVGGRVTSSLKLNLWA